MQQHGALSFSLPSMRAVAAALIMLACSGCSTAPNTLCLSSRPIWSFNDTQPIRAKKTAAAKRWDNQCTLVGVIRSAAAGR